jgi:hypothetical protein
MLRKLLRSKLTRVLCVIGVGLALTACDQCGDFKVQACRQQAPSPSQ